MTHDGDGVSIQKYSVDCKRVQRSFLKAIGWSGRHLTECQVAFFLIKRDRLIFLKVIMKHVGMAWDEIKTRLARKTIVFFLDYDGTLAPIMDQPEKADLGPKERRLIDALGHQPRTRVMIISGRELSNVKARVGVPGLVYAGNHGLELEGPQIQHVHPAAFEFKHLAKNLEKRLREVFSDIPGILVEFKTFTLSIHYRKLMEDQIEYAKMRLLKELGPYLGKSQVLLTEGKKVWEVRPPTEWNKGKTVLWLLGRLIARLGRQVVPVYIGDDLTDEDAFQALRKRGVTIKVTEEPQERSSALYYVKNPKEVFDFLQCFVHQREQG